MNTKTEIKKALTSILFLAVGLLVTDRIVGRAAGWINRHSRDAFEVKLRYVVNDIDKDMVLLGTSRCFCHYDPDIIADSIGMTAYNAGLNGSDNIISHYFILCQILRHHTPQVVGVDLMTNDYTSSHCFFANKTAPYIGICQQADSVFREADNYHFIRFCNLYRYNARILPNIGGLLVNQENLYPNGFEPIPVSKYFPTKTDSVHTPRTIDSLRLKYLHKFIALCQAHDIRLVFMVSPAYSLPEADLYDVLKDIAAANDIPLLDYHTKGVFLDHPEYFHDATHLNVDGAKRYTALFAGDLKRILALPTAVLYRSSK